MAVTVRIPSYLAGFANGQTVFTVDGAAGDVRALLQALWQLHPALRDRIVDEQNQVRQHINVFVDGEAIRLTGGLDTQVADKAEILIVPAVSGG